MRQVSQYATYVYRLTVALEETAVQSQAEHLLKSKLQQLLLALREIQGEWEHELERRQMPEAVTSRSRDRNVRLPAITLGRIQHGVGRPFIDITEQRLYALHSLGLSWTVVSSAILGMNTKPSLPLPPSLPPPSHNLVVFHCVELLLGEWQSD